MMVASDREAIWHPDLVLQVHRRVVAHLVEVRRMTGWFEGVDLEDTAYQGIAVALRSSEETVRGDI
jgi:hypothetical protein